MNNFRITVKFDTKVAHDKFLPHAKQNSKISTDIIDNDIIISKFERFRIKKHSISKCFISVVCG